MTMRQVIAKYRGVLIASAFAIAVGGLLGVSFGIEAGSCDNPMRGLGAGIVFFLLLIIGGALAIGAVLGGLIGWLWRHDRAIVRQALGVLAIGVLVPGSFIVVATLASARCV